MVPADSRRISRVLRYSGAVSPVSPFSPTGLSPAVARLSNTVRLTFLQNLLTVLLPRRLRKHNRGLGYAAFDRLYLRYHSCFLFLPLLRCFSSQGSLPSFAWMGLSARVAPFGYLRVNGYLPLAAAFRSLSRPSSPPRA